MSHSRIPPPRSSISSQHQAAGAASSQTDDTVGADAERFYPPPPNNLPLLQTFVGRERELALLRDQFPAGTLAIVGADGVGKSSLALEFARRFIHDFKLVWWVRGEAPEFIEEDLLSLAILLNLNQGTIQEQRARLEDFFHRNTHWLLVVDDASTPQEIRPLLPKSGSGRVLVTSSREASWDGMVDTLCLLTPLSPEEGVSSLAWRMGREAGPDEVSLVHELQNNPLAIAMAGACLSNAACCTDELLQAVRHRKKQDETAWERLGHYALACLAKISPLGVGALEMLVFFASGIPLPVLVSGRGKFPRISGHLPSTAESWRHVVEMLVKLGLIEVQDDVVYVHARIRFLVQSTLSLHQQRLRAEAALRLIDDHFDWRWDASDAWRHPGHLAPLAAVTAQRADVWGVEAETIALVLNQAGSFYHGLENFHRATDLLRRAMTLVENNYGPVHPAIASCANNLGAVLEDMGDLRGSKELLERALRIDELCYGAFHPNVAINASNLAVVLLNLGETDRAVELFKRALRIHATHKGENHPDLACHFHNLGQVYLRMETWNLARETLQRAVAAYRAGLGPEHPDTRLCQEHLAEIPSL
ncbi:MAG: tetratricopeptide repeat protein [Magnetococcales bacterium]|nr:tetratricopeptide repeat protein [Magnetococcales bacterium]